jgi:hypothetical protein
MTENDPTAPTGPPGDGPPEGTPPPADAATPRCSECGAELADDQTYCIECGTPTPRAPRLRRGRRTGLLIALALLVIGGGAAALAYAVANEDDGPTAGGSTEVIVTGATTVIPGTDYTLPTDGYTVTGELPPDTTGFPTAPGTDEFPVVTEQTDPDDPTGTFDPSTDIPPVDPIDPVDPVDPGTGASDWPVGTTAWTAILSSTRSESEARSTADAVAATGEESGVLFSTDHPGLTPGYWVVFSGSFTSSADAAAHARALSGSYPGAYPRQIQG